LQRNTKENGSKRYGHEGTRGLYIVSEKEERERTGTSWNGLRTDFSVWRTDE